jgi:Zn-dependent protease
MLMSGRRFKIAQIRGVPIYVASSWLWIAVLVLFTQYVALTGSRWRPEPAEAAMLAALDFVLFFGGVLLHEAAHAIAARGFGLPVRAITLVFWGGATETRSWRKGAAADFVVAAVGPLTTLALAVIFMFVADAMTPSAAQEVISYLATLNFLFAAFNAIPGFPLDGGRMLMALTWGITRNRVLALRVAGFGSLLVGGALIFYALLSLGNGNGGALFFGYIGFVLISAGRQIPQRAALRQKLQRGTAADAMRPAHERIPAGISLRDATERWLRAVPNITFPVEDNGRLVGAVSLAEAGRVAAARPVREAMVPLEHAITVEANESLDDVVEWVGSGDGLVLDDRGGVAGVIRIEDVDHWLQTHWATGQYREEPPAAVPPRPDA